MIKVNRSGSFVNEKDKIVSLYFISGEPTLQTIIKGFEDGSFDKNDITVFLPLFNFHEVIKDYK